MSNHQEIKAKFTSALLHPRYWFTWFGFGILYLLVLLPYPVICQLGKALGLLSRKIVRKRQETARQNLKLCFPNLSEHEQNRMLRENFISTGIAIFETGIAWFWSDKRLKKWIKVNGFEHIAKAQKQKKGILLIGLHFLTLELGGRILGLYTKGVGVYRPNSNLVIDYLQLKGRMRASKYMLDRDNTKGMIRALRNGELIWYAPDHDYGAKNSVFAPLFAVEKAATTIGTTILVKLGDPVIIPFSPIREKSGGYTVSISKPLENYPLNDQTEAATYMNKAIECEILKAPEQYMWLHRRFKTRPKGEAPLYSDEVQSD